MDNVIKSLIISCGFSLLFVIVLFGVFGGVVVFGVIGLFIGLILLVVGYCLIMEWIIMIEFLFLLDEDWDELVGDV